MRTHLSLAGLVVFALCSAASAQLEGPEWVEQADAGSTPGTAQPVQGTGQQLSRISGTLTGLGATAGAGDFEDMYLITISAPTMFSLRTDPSSVGGMASFDTQLWVFAADGLGILGNNNAAPTIAGTVGTGGSAIFQFATDGTQAGILTPGNYLVCISGAGNTPHSTQDKDGEPFPNQIYFFKSQFEVSGPDGEGGAFPVSGWEPSGATGTYTIALTGTTHLLPAPGALPVLLFALPWARRRRA